MKLPARVQEAMQMQVEAERKKRAAILESEGMNLRLIISFFIFFLIFFFFHFLIRFFFSI